MYTFILLVVCLAQHSNSHENCVNDSSVLWKSLDIWNVAELRKKWYSHPVRELSQLCRTEFGDFLEGASNGSVWAIKMLDSSGHYGGGLFGGNEFWLGSETLCRNLEYTRRSKYGQNVISLITDQDARRTSENRIVSSMDPLDIYSIPPYPVRFSVASITVNMTTICQLANAREPVINVGLCLPRSCETPDIRTALDWATDRAMTLPKIRILLAEGFYSMWNDTRFYILSCLFVIVALLMIAGTALEVFCGQKKSSNCLFKVFNCFSVIGNVRSIFSLEVGEDTLSPIHGLKFISMLWVIMVHSCLLIFQVAENKKYRDSVESALMYQTISNGTFAVDTFFTLSGVLVSFLFFRTVDKYPIKKLTGYGGYFGKLIMYISMLVYRIIRLSPPYMIVVVLTGFLMELKLTNAPLHIPNLDQINCAQHWWRNALFINTFYPSVEMCMMWSWYLANDTQFYILGIFLILIALKHRLIALFLGVALLIASWIVTALISIQTNHIIDARDPFADYDALYDKPWTRVGPYLIGMVTGWILYRFKCQLTIGKALNVGIWICSLTSMVLVIYGPMFLPNNPIIGALYTTLSHSVWSTAVSWILIGCVTGNAKWVNPILSWRYMYPLSRLSYCAYLVHPMVMRAVLLSSNSPFHISVEILATLFFGFLSLSLIAAGILSLAFEAPMVALLRLAHPMRTKE